MTDVFSERLAAWREYCEQPWARLRYEVVADTLRRHTGERALRVLDVGGGDGRDALPLALAGHHVTVLDPSPSWLAEAQRRSAAAGVTLTTLEGGLDALPAGTWDLVLCHFVLRYRPPSAPDLAALADRVGPGGLLSIVEGNPDGMVLARLVRSGPAEALAELEASTLRSVTFDHDARKITREEVEAELAALGFRVAGRYGLRIANDLTLDDDAKRDPAFYADLLRLELALCDREPFNRIGFGWHVVAQRP